MLDRSRQRIRLRARSSALNQRFGPAFKQHLDLGSIFYGRCDAPAECGMFQDVACFVLVLGRIGLRARRILRFQERYRLERTFVGGGAGPLPGSRGCDRRGVAPGGLGL